MTPRYGIAEWFGRPFERLSVKDRQKLARCALAHEPAPSCPFQRGRPPCNKRGGVCSIKQGTKPPVITCPKRFDEGNLLPEWLAEIAGFPDVFIAPEVPFMRSPATGRPAGRIDLVVSDDITAKTWFGLEIQAVYFSGQGMTADFELLLHNSADIPPPPTAVRRPDWRSSSAKRLMPQLQIKAPTLRRWSTKLAVAVDRPFFNAIGGPTSAPSKDVNDGDIVWLIPRITDDYRLIAEHWEVLSLEDSCAKLLSAATIKREEFEVALRSKLQRLCARKRFP
ncbi:MAG: NotI family restriction endonuclease [Aestuariivita sp.]|nr:NotI family restriction endonuclease [Aestuariivita sp.]